MFVVHWVWEVVWVDAGRLVVVGRLVVHIGGVAGVFVVLVVLVWFGVLGRASFLFWTGGLLLFPWPSV